MLKYILFLFVILMQACAPALPARLTKPAITTDTLRPPFSSKSESMLFKAHFEYGKKIKIGGLLLIKQTKPSVYRVLLMAELGTTLFDFEFSDNNFTVHRSFAALNRPIFLKIIENDIKLLLMQRPFANSIKHWKTDNYTIYRSLQEGKHYTYAQTEMRWAFFQQNRSLRISFHDYQAQSIAKRVELKHYFFPLKMELEAISNEN